MIWFKFYSAWGDGVQELSDAEAGRFIKALCACAESEEIPSLSGAEKVLYSIASKQLKQDAERNAEISRTRAEAGRIGGLSSKQTEVNSSKTSKCQQMQAKQANASKCSIKNTELRIQNTEVKSIAETDVSAKESIKITPDDSDFWKFAKENSELAETFYKATGIFPVKSQFGRWVKDLRDLAEAEIDSERLQKTIAYMQGEGIPLSAPGSCLKTAQYLKSRGSVPVRRKETAHRESWSEVADRIASEQNPFDIDYALPEHETEVIDL